MQFKKFKGKNKKSFVRPKSMAGLPDSDSTQSEEDKEMQGLTIAAVEIGDGAAMYLQSMKTLAIMFLCLTILNLPIYFAY